MSLKSKSPYTAALTGCSFLYNEFQRILPLLMNSDAEQLIKNEIDNNLILHVNSLTSRKRFISEFKRRYAAAPIIFWNEWQQWGETAQRAGLFYAILKTYKLVFDFHFNVALRKWNSIDHQLTHMDVMMEFNEIASHDEFVDSWSDNTKTRCASQYLTFLRQAGLLNAVTNELQPIHLSAHEFEYYIKMGEEWFLEACFLYPYEINELKIQLS